MPLEAADEEAAEWVQAALMGDATLMSLFGGTPRCYADVAPQNATYPLLIVSVLDCLDVQFLDRHRVACTVTLMVKAVGRRGYSELKPYRTAVDLALQGSGGVAGSTAVGNWRGESTIRQTEVDENVTYFNLGRTYGSFLSQA